MSQLLLHAPTDPSIHPFTLGTGMVTGCLMMIQRQRRSAGKSTDFSRNIWNSIETKCVFSFRVHRHFCSRCSEHAYSLLLRVDEQ